ncbi:MAG: hypothetical protein QXI64_10740 [Sulfolobales archaeon]
MPELTSRRRKVDVELLDVYEKLEEIESIAMQLKTMLSNTIERIEALEEAIRGGRRHSTWREERGGARRSGKKAVDVLAEQGYIFASEIKARGDAKARIIDAIKRSGRAIVIQGSSDTLLIHKDYLETFLDVLEKKGEDSLDDKQKKLYWILTENKLLEKTPRGYKLAV